MDSGMRKKALSDGYKHLRTKQFEGRFCHLMWWQKSEFANREGSIRELNFKH